MKLLRIVRLLLALTALAFSMAGPATAAVSMAPRDLPCHDAGATAPAVGGMAHASSGPVFPVHMAAPAGMTPHPDPARQHMCCVVSQLVAPPLAGPALRHPEARAVALPVGPGGAMASREPAIPVPPPRPS